METLVNPVLVRFDEIQEFSSYQAVAVPLDGTESKTRVAMAVSKAEPDVSFGVWECTPGRWRRMVEKSEYSYIISGTGTFTPDGGEEVAFKGGDVLYFQPNTQGIWNIIETVRKHYFIHA